MTGDPQLPRFDQGPYVKFARLSIVASVTVAAITALTLLTVKPPTQCPRWHLPDGANTSMWVLLGGWTTPFLAGGCFFAICWNWVIRRMITEEERGRARPQGVPLDYILIHMCVAIAVFSQFPLFLLVTKCTDWFWR
jgi:hypothetical protein